MPTIKLNKLIKSNQQGAITLFVTGLLLVTSLVMTIASYKQAHLQIKQVQNQLLARKAYWFSEGGIECAFAQISSKVEVFEQKEHSDPKALLAEDFAECVFLMELSNIEIDEFAEHRYLLSATYKQDAGAKAKIKRSFQHIELANSPDEQITADSNQSRSKLKWLKGSWHDF
ncbi:MAG: hypothetical protein ACK5NC_13130 [Vibrio sp.]